jgi:hypothetical protein
VPLVEQLRGCDRLADAAGLLDCEVSIGRIVDGRWHIARSTLPHRVGVHLSPVLDGDGSGRLRTRECDLNGRAGTRRWEVIEAEGAPRLLTSDSAEPSHQPI